MLQVGTWGRHWVAAASKVVNKKTFYVDHGKQISVTMSDLQFCCYSWCHLLGCPGSWVVFIYYKKSNWSYDTCFRRTKWFQYGEVLFETVLWECCQPWNCFIFQVYNSDPVWKLWLAGVSAAYVTAISNFHEVCQYTCVRCIVKVGNKMFQYFAVTNTIREGCSVAKCILMQP